MHKSPDDFMSFALQEAEKAYALDEVPVGSVIVKNGNIIGVGFNQVISHRSVASHAEINAIISASKALNNYRLNECDIYVTFRALSYVCKSNRRCKVGKIYFLVLWSPKLGLFYL